MSSVLATLVVVIAVEHLWFLVLEMFLWTRPIGLRTFRNSPEVARQSAALAANQGLCNGFLAAGLLRGAFHPVAGVFGAITVSRRILVLQAFPAMLGLVLACLG